MHLGVGQVQVERLALLVGAAHEVGRPSGDLAVEAGPELRVVGGDDLVLFALLARVDRLVLQRDLHVTGVRGRGDRPFGEVGLHRPQHLIGGPRAPHRLVEPEVDRAAVLRIAAQVPLAPHPGRVACVRQRAGDGDLPLGHAIGATGHRHGLRARADQVAAGQDGRPAWRALGLDVEVQQLQPLVSELVDARRRRAAQHPAAVAAQLTPAEVVPPEHRDVRLLIGHVIPLTFRPVLG